MLNRTKVLSTGLLLSGMMTWAPAQTNYTATPEAAGATASGIMAPRTGEYPGSINGAADNTVDDYTKRGTLINGKQYITAWGGAALINGAYSFQAIGFDWFGAMTAPAAAGSGTWRSGIATSKWAAGLLVNFNKTTNKTALGENKVVVANDGFGVFGDFNLGTSDVYGQVSLLTGPGNYTKTTLVGPPQATAEVTPSIIHLMAGWKKDATSEGTHALNAEVTLDLGSTETAPPAPAPKTTNKFTNLNVLFSHGYIVKASSSYSVFLGSNSTIDYRSSDISGTTADPGQTRLAIAPNIVFHKDLGHNFEFTSGAAGTLSYTMYSDDVVPTLGPSQEGTNLLTTSADVNLGLRWVKDNFSVQGSLNEGLLQGGPNFITGANNALFAQVGVSLGF